MAAFCSSPGVAGGEEGEEGEEEGEDVVEDELAVDEGVGFEPPSGLDGSAE